MIQARGTRASRASTAIPSFAVPIRSAISCSSGVCLTFIAPPFLVAMGRRRPLFESSEGLVPIILPSRPRGHPGPHPQAPGLAARPCQPGACGYNVPPGTLHRFATPARYYMQAPLYSHGDRMGALRAVAGGWSMGFLDRLFGQGLPQEVGITAGRNRHRGRALLPGRPGVQRWP
jgi:hypothetical protein